jgi:uncharacterized protein (TIGR03086 family)
MTWEQRGYERALDGFQETLSGVRVWTVRSPCAEWTAYDVAGHVIGGQYLIKALALGEPVPDATTDPGRYCEADPVASWAKARTGCAAVLSAEALARPVPLGMLGEVPLGDFLGGYILELLTHTWDLATATGQDADLPADLVHHAFATAQVIAPALRAAGQLGPPLPPPPRAGELTRLLAFLGRTAPP